MLGEATLGILKPLFAGPLPYRGGDLSVSFASAGGFGRMDGDVSVDLFDVMGRHVRRLASGRFPIGTHATTWDGRDAQGRAVASGVDFVRLTSAGLS